MVNRRFVEGLIVEMHKVVRTAKPLILDAHALDWTNELLDQIVKCGSYSNVPNKYTDCYRQDDVKDALNQMYGGRCCFCESDTSVSNYDIIEHLKPKSIFPELSFEWDNLHYICFICNSIYKKDKWDYTNPILDPSNDEIQDFIKFNLNTGEYEPIGGSLRAKTTIEHIGLCRDKLISKRKQLLVGTALIIKKYLATGDAILAIQYLTYAESNFAYTTVYSTLRKLIETKYL